MFQKTSIPRDYNNVIRAKSYIFISYRLYCIIGVLYISSYIIKRFNIPNKKLKVKI